MSEKKITAKAVMDGREKVTARPDTPRRDTICLVRPTCGKAIADGWTIALSQRDGGALQLLGDIQVAAFLAGEDKTSKGEKKAAGEVAKEIRDIAARLTDLPHLLAAAWELCQKTGFRPCRSLAMFGAGAAAKVEEIDRVRADMAALRTELKDATAAYMSLVFAGKKADKAQERARAAKKALDDAIPAFKAADAKYRKEARAAVALLGVIADNRKAD